ncbi:DUF3592 domain-containing protein [Streptomyces sp. NRRL S-340]|uniref:DUF3592 domain-containing protein n=1 Tax=Streptomyces sp. NRRL S-340 TaxID=1463901 RepID=UPI0005663D36|nr:DUF3592 domain-containing protein [Streptomyces sp. NRRL S-340]
MAVGGAGGRTLTVVLTAAGEPSAAYSLTCRDAAAGRAFAEAVGRELDAHPGGEPRPDGWGQVREERLRRWASAPRRGPGWAAAAVYALVAAVLLVSRADAAAVFGWPAGPLVLGPAAVAVMGGAGLVRQAWVLRARGIAAPARLRRSCAVHGSDEPSEHHVYTYVDADGLMREWRGAGSGAERAEILYDPADPEVAVFGRDTAGRLAGGFAFALGLGGALLFIAAMLLAPAVRALTG